MEQSREACMGQTIEQSIDEAPEGRRAGQADEGAQEVLLVQASPHALGTTSALVRTLAGSLVPSCRVRILDLSSLRMEDCTHCGRCRRPPFSCVLAKEDACEAVFAALRAAKAVVWISPVYFYGLPARAKALVDRSQRFFEHPQKLPHPAPRVLTVFVAGRPRGAQLFTGSHLALKYFCQSLGLNLVCACGLRGLETDTDVTPIVQAEAARALARVFPDLVPAGAQAPCGQADQVCQSGFSHLDILWSTL